MIKILFVCHGNICRSPMAEFILKDMVKKQGIADQFVICSAATSTEEIWNGIGNPVYPPARKELAKQAKATAEQSRVAVRNIRRDAMEDLKKMQKAGDISEDQQKDGETKIQKLTDSAIADINKVAETKEKEIMEI